jgi:hypothetical protein
MIQLFWHRHDYLQASYIEHRKKDTWLAHPTHMGSQIKIIHDTIVLIHKTELQIFHESAQNYSKQTPIGPHLNNIYRSPINNSLKRTTRFRSGLLWGAYINIMHTTSASIATIVSLIMAVTIMKIDRPRRWWGWR